MFGRGTGRGVSGSAFLGFGVSAAMALSASVGTVVVVAPGASAQPEQRADADLPDGFEVLERALEALGGVEKLRKPKTTRSVGTFEMPSMGFSGPITIMRASPNKMRLIIEIPGVGQVDQGTDGAVAWTAQPGAGTQMLEGDEKAAMLRNADIERRFTPRKSFSKAETVGIETIRGEEAYRLELETLEGESRVEFFSVETGLQLREVTTETTNGFSIERATDYLEYAEFDGVKVPMKMLITMRTPQGEMVQHITFSSYEEDAELEAGAFAAPGSF